jgi:hypothetical protein
VPTLHDPRDLRASRAGGARSTSTRGRRCHPRVAAAAGAVDVLDARLRRGCAHALRRAAGGVAETISSLRAARATGPGCLRAESGFGGRMVRTCRQRIVGLSITVRLRLRATVHRPIVEVPEEAWIPVPSPATAAGPAGRGSD